MDELTQAYEELIGATAGGEAPAIRQGRAPSLHRYDRDSHELAEPVRRYPAVAAAIAEGERSVETLARLEGGAEFVGELETFLSTHGDIGQESLDLESAAWRDDPAKVLAVLAQRLRSEGEHPDARVARVRARASETLDRARARLAERPGDLARFDEILAAAMSAGPLTEEHNYWIDRLSRAQVRRIARAIGARLAREGTLASADEVFLLYVPEVADALRSPRALGDLVRSRRRDLARWQRLVAPKTVGAPPRAPDPVTPGVGPQPVDGVTREDPH